MGTATTTEAWLERALAHGTSPISIVLKPVPRSTSGTHGHNERGAGVPATGPTVRVPSVPGQTSETELTHHKECRASSRHADEMNKCSGAGCRSMTAIATVLDRRRCGIDCYWAAAPPDGHIFGSLNRPWTRDWAKLCFVLFTACG
ncbi:hypothetical protein BKA15_003565 [Microlunatus parietis]|uniref:Uncharacterized protein n=1 Tax=Microlunatus parietis TaxID=682979 RepID=A0A7Y9I8E0_9ACTN|nr:hypothetical protein [Microlunatus parietis]